MRPLQLFPLVLLAGCCPRDSECCSGPGELSLTAAWLDLDSLEDADSVSLSVEIQDHTHELVILADIPLEPSGDGRWMLPEDAWIDRGDCCAYDATVTVDLDIEGGLEVGGNAQVEELNFDVAVDRDTTAIVDLWGDWKVRFEWAGWST